MQGQCPNCGGDLTAYRVERQAAGHREAVLRWSICADCGHVALQNWSLVDSAESELSPNHVPVGPSGEATGA